MTEADDWSDLYLTALLTVAAAAAGLLVFAVLVAVGFIPLALWTLGQETWYWARDRWRWGWRQR